MPSGNALAFAAPPDAVRVWRGFRRLDVEDQTFVTTLGSTFIPVTAQVQRLYGLRAYLPTVLPRNKPEGVPDEIALVFYRSEQAYLDTKRIVLGRAYADLHETIFDLDRSLSAFPQRFGGRLEVGAPYHLYPDAADWQQGYTRVYVGGRPATQSSEVFRRAHCVCVLDLVENRPAGLQGVVISCASDWVVYWEHWRSEDAAVQGSRLAGVAALSTRILLEHATNQQIVEDLAAINGGLELRGGECLNIVFERVDG